MVPRISCTDLIAHTSASHIHTGSEYATIKKGDKWIVKEKSKVILTCQASRETKKTTEATDAVMFLHCQADLKTSTANHDAFKNDVETF